MPPKKGKSGGAKGGGGKGGAKGGECMLQSLTFRFLALLFFFCTLISVEVCILGMTLYRFSNEDQVNLHKPCR